MKKVIYAVFFLVFVYLFLCFIGPSTTHIHREIRMQVPVSVVMERLYDLKFFQEKWSPWTEKDPTMKVTYRGEMGIKGSSLAWESNNENVGKGSMTYRYTNRDTVMMNLHFDDFGDSKLYHLVQKNGNGTRVSWNMLSENGFFSRAFLLFMDLDAMVGPDFEKGLRKLKMELEREQASA